MSEQRQSRPSRRAVLTGIGVAGGAGLLGEGLAAVPASAGVRPGISSVTSVHGSGTTDFVLDLIGWVV